MAVGAARDRRRTSALDPEAVAPLPHLHVAFRVTSRQQVLDFFATAQDLRAAIVCPPGLHPEYHASYFSAFVRDPDGHNLEAVIPPDPSDDQAPLTLVTRRASLILAMTSTARGEESSGALRRCT